MCDGNRRPNYDGCLLPPRFIGPGDPYAVPETHRLADFFKRPEHHTTFKGGRGTWKDCRPGAMHPIPSQASIPDKERVLGTKQARPATTGAVSKTRGRRQGEAKSYLGGRPKTQNGLFSAIYDSDPPRRSGEDAIGFRQGPGRHGANAQTERPRVGRFKTDAEYRENVGRGRGGVFSTTGYIGPSDSGKQTCHEQPMYRGERRDYFDPNPYGSSGPTAEVRQRPSLDMKKYRPKDIPGRGVYRDSRNWTNTFDFYPAHTAEAYSDPAFRGGLRDGRSEFYTYQNKTRTAYADTHGVANVNGESWSQKRINNGKANLRNRDFNRTDSVHLARGLSRCSGRIAR
eukprot:gb/GECG01009661.1/.p1 GENE.gb/GECG01009661.1/~~gb/GECG01009661.1/.p1  ORF type:complete len:342 (+),score=20.77 gb/GECG01009661.1/:1-1026(+)